MNLKQQIALNPRLLFWGRALVETKTLSAVIVLFYLHRGLGLDEVFYLSIVWSLTSLVTEVPSGYLTDHIGRKRTLLLGVLLLIVSQVLTFFSYGFYPFVLSFVFMSASFSCFSGTEEALLYESLVETGKEDEMNRRNGKQLSARSLPDIFLPAIGAFIASGLLESQFQLLIALNIVASVFAFFLLSRLTEPRRNQYVAERELGVFAQSIQTIRNDPWLLKVALNKLLVFIASFILWRMSQPFLVQHGFGVEALGAFYVLFQGLQFGVGWFAGQIERLVGTARIIALSAWMTIIGVVVAIITTHPLVAFASLAIAISADALREPLFAHAVNNRIHSRSRATTLSNLNMMKGILDIPILLLAGWLSNGSLNHPLLLAVALCIIAVIVFPIRSRELQGQNNPTAATAS